MAKKNTFAVRFAPLQRVVAEPITDPAEQAALDRARIREKGRRARKGKVGRRGPTRQKGE
jgi:hypothetical protein